MKGTDGIVARALARALKPHLQSIAGALQSHSERLRALESGAAARQLADAYSGVWREQQYEPGALVTHGGALWLAHSSTSERPGTTSSWQLVMKSARR